jgi:hypothetical protein
MKLFQQLDKNLEAMSQQEVRVGESQFERSRIPALTEVVLGRCKDSPSAIVIELLELRRIHRGFREYLTACERKWNSAITKREQWKLQSEFDSALKLLMEKEKRQSTRLIYRLWEYIKAPTKIVTTIGDRAAKKGQDKYLVGRAKGLHDFWNDLANSPPSDVARVQFDRLFRSHSDDKTWESGKKLAEAVNAGLAR